MKRLYSFLPSVFFSLFTVLIIIFSKTAVMGAASGLLLCGRVIIPSLFAFTCCILFLSKSGIIDLLSPLDGIFEKLFHLSARHFFLTLLSFTGGYPIGAKLLEEEVASHKISSKKAGFMLCYSVNAGPAFVIIAVGKGILNSPEIGYLLMFSHLFSAIILAFLFRNKIKPENLTLQKEAPPNGAELFVWSVSSGASAIFTVCAYVIFFSVIISFANKAAEILPQFKYLTALLEVTNGVALVRNIPIISFLLGFGGISVWCQVFAIGKHISVNKFLFFLSRLAHGGLSLLFTAVIIKIFNISVPAVTVIRAKPFWGGIDLFLSTLLTVTVFIFSCFSENRGRNPLKDLI